MSAINPESINFTTLPFTEFGIWCDLPEIAAVYFCSNAEAQILYVGQTTNLKTRWSNNHDKRSSCAELGAVKVSWLEVETDPLPFVRFFAFHFAYPDIANF